jgi:hypothetical protein
MRTSIGSVTALAILLARPANAAPLIERPLTLPAGELDPILLGNYSNWAAECSACSSDAGESAAIGLDFGISPSTQVGLGIGLPVNPGFAFGSLTFDALFGVSATTAVRLDAGMESIGQNGVTGASHATRWFGGAGPYLRVPLSANAAFVWGRSGAVRFSRFLNLDIGGGGGFYYGSSYLPVGAGADLLAISAGNNQSGTVIDINLPMGILLQPNPTVAITLQAGYSAVIGIPSGGGSTTTLHFLPVGLEAVLSPAASLDIGLNLVLDGYFAQSGGNGSNGPGYFDLRTVLLWFRIRTST